MTIEFWWHVHHEILCEPLTEPIENRAVYIRQNKPPSEVPTRLRWLTPIEHPERLPSEWKKAYLKWSEADRKWEEVHDLRAYWRLEHTRHRLNEADQKWRLEIEALHKEEHPGCPWTGATILV